MTESKKYYKDIKKLFPIHGKKEKKFLNNIKEQINEYKYENPQATYEEYSQMIGTPIDIVISYYQESDSTYLLKRINIKRMLIYVCVICITFIALTSCYEMYTVYKAKQKFDDMFPITWEERIEYIE